MAISCYDLIFCLVDFEASKITNKGKYIFMKDVRYSLIYRFFLTQIKFGNYQYGDVLPPIRVVDKFYNSSAPTVRNAYLLLQEEGYISLSSGRMTRVISDISEEECHKNVRSYYLARRDEIRRLYETTFYVLLPLFEEGGRRLEDGQLEYIREACEEVKDIDFYSSFIVGQEMIRALNNQLALNLYYEILAFCQFAHTLNKRETLPEVTKRCNRLSCQVVEACKRKDRRELYRVFVQIQAAMGEVIDSLLDCKGEERSTQEQKAFEWGIYRERPQLCYSLAAKFITDIMINRRYSRGEYLPTYAAMAKMYSVSLSTIRRTIKLLEELGVVEPLHGIGTRVAVEPVNRPHQQWGGAKSVITLFLEVMQIVQVTFNDASESFFCIRNENLQSCVTQMKIHISKGACFSPFLICMDYLLCGNDNASMSEIGGRLYEGIVLGIPLVEAFAAPPVRCRIRTCSEKIMDCLEKGDISSCHRVLGECMDMASETAKEVLTLQNCG